MKPQEYYSTYQLKLPVDIERIIEISVELSMIGDTYSEILVKVEIVKFSRSEKFTILP